MTSRLPSAINLLTVPVVVGQGTRLFPDTGPDITLELVGSQAVTPSGVTIQTYRPAGRPRYETGLGHLKHTASLIHGSTHASVVDANIRS